MNPNIEFCTIYYNDPVCSLQQEPTSGTTPSLAALDNAQTFRWREWIRGEPGEDMPQQYSSISGHFNTNFT